MKGIMLSEIIQTEEDKYYMISLICGYVFITYMCLSKT